ncbi:MAG: thioredoxin reductase [candidate division Zixibacteria bacterium DG_27]|nr:MAG: thioredoxin reductase [candidate division Zixibacteria bacterium DG_27]
MKEYDIIIVGGGPGGLTAGMYGARSALKTLIIERYLPGGQVANTELIEDYPGFESISGAELATRMSEHAKKFGAEIISEDVSEVYCEKNDRIVVTDEEKYKAPVVIIATGGQPRKLGVPGEEEFAGRGVSYCAICDGAFFKDQKIAVVGGGDAAVEEANFLTKYGSKVYIIHRRDELRAQKIIQERAFKNEKIEFVWDSVVEKVNGKQKVESLTLKNKKTAEANQLQVGAVFVFIGFVPNSKLVREGLNLDPNGYILTNDRMETNIPGIYAVGDVRAQLCRQVTNAVGDGTTAAVAADKYIESLRE